jgi:hypothetical protein
MEEDNDLKEAIAECAKVVEAKCGKRPYMIVISKANVKFASPEHKAKGIITGTASYMYLAKPTLKKNGLSKLLIDTARVAVGKAEKKAVGDS